jgi:DNA-binding MarR family transcriptional regulator
VQKLLQRRLLKRESDPTDLRSYVLHLTPAGRKIFDETMVPMVEHQTTMLAGLSEDEQRQLCVLMDKLVIASPAWPQELQS